MNKFKFYFILIITSITIFSCSKNDDSATVEPLRDFQKQHDADIATIEDYLKTNYIEVKQNPGFTDDQNVTIEKLDANHTESIWNQTTYPLKTRTVKLHGIEYTIYYLVLREGKKDAVTGLGGVSPCNVDGVLTSYKGIYLSNTTTTPSTTTATQFEENPLPNNFQDLFVGVITGWGEIFPQFKTGSYVSNPNGTITYTDFGAGVMFLPSGLGYYASGSGAIPAYSPLVFSFKLYEIQRADQDGDGIPSYLEDLNGDGYMRILATGVVNPDDTDKDGIPDFYDVDDDGDNYTTKLEITKPGGSNLLLDGPSAYYPFDPIVSDPPKATDEKRGVPAYSAAGTPDYTSPGRKRIHLDKEHHTAKP